MKWRGGGREEGIGVKCRGGRKGGEEGIGVKWRGGRRG